MYIVLQSYINISNYVYNLKNSCFNFDYIQSVLYICTVKLNNKQIFKLLL